MTAFLLLIGSLFVHADTIDALAQSFAPEIVFHTEESCAASDATVYFEALKHKTPTTDFKHLCKRRAEDTTPIYWIESESPWIKQFQKTQGTTWRLIEYWYFTPYNDTTVWFNIGDHNADWEGIAVLVKTNEKNEHIPIAIYMAQHKTGTWYCANDVEWTKIETQTHPKVYSAKNTHATYNKPGSQNHGLIITDHTNTGHTWQTWKNTAPLQTQLFYDYQDKWGANTWFPWNNAPRGPHAQKKFYPRDTSPKQIAQSIKTLRQNCYIQ